MSFNQATSEEISAAHDLIASFELEDRIEVAPNASASDIEAGGVIWVQAWIRVPASAGRTERSYGEIEAASWKQLRPVVAEARSAPARAFVAYVEDDGIGGHGGYDRGSL